MTIITYNTPDRKAPRFRSRRTGLLNIPLHKAFIKKYPKYKDLDLKTFRKIVRTFNIELYNGVIDNRDGVMLPEGLGFIFMGTCPASKKINVDPVKSMKLGRVVRYQNWDSDNKLWKIFYTNHNSRYPLQNKQVWAFVPVRHFKSAASKAYKENWQKYIVVDPLKKISSFFTKIRRRDFVREDIKHVPADYDEFKI